MGSVTLDRLAILTTVRPRHREAVEVPEWGGRVFVRVLSASERDELEKLWELTKRANFRARLAVACVCDEEGKDLFLIGDIEALGEQPAPALQRIAAVALRINGFTVEAQEDIEKNSNGQADDF